MERYIGLLGMVVMFVICWALSTDRKKIDWKLVFCGTFLQAVFALIMLKTQWGKWVF